MIEAKFCGFEFSSFYTQFLQVIAEEKKLAIFSLQDDAEFEREEYDRFALCGWKSKWEVFDNAAREFQNLGARRLSGEELAAEFENPGLDWILGYELMRGEMRKIIEQS